jgi:predicted RNA-binding protein with TRAM domain
MTMHYNDKEPVEVGDEIWFYIDDTEYDGWVIARYPRKREIKISYRDFTDCRKSDGAAKIKSMVIPVHGAELARRAM